MTLDEMTDRYIRQEAAAELAIATKLRMQLRDEFAKAALIGAIANPNNLLPKDEIADHCYRMADAMLERRGKP